VTLKKLQYSRDFFGGCPKIGGCPCGVTRYSSQKPGCVTLYIPSTAAMSRPIFEKTTE